MGLTQEDRDLVVECMRQGKPVPSRLRWDLFEDPPNTELIWSGKTSEVETAVLPFQSVELIGNEPQVGEWTNKLIFGDNKLILSSLTNGPMRQQIEEAGGLKLVYVDPPFDVGADFSVDIQVGDEDVVTKAPSVIEEIAYRDTWGENGERYAPFIAERIRLIHTLLSPGGIFAIHIDWRLVHLIRAIADEIFGRDHFVNEVIWHFDYGARSKGAFGRKHNNILIYAKSDYWTFNSSSVLVPYESKMTEWRYTQGGQAGKNMPAGKVPSDVWDIKLNAMSQEHIGYPTQKPEALLKRLCAAFSNPGDLVGDFFSGSGTTLAVAEKLGRKWIGADLGRFAIHTSRKRLIQVQRDLQQASESYRSFEILNLGKYERDVAYIEAEAKTKDLDCIITLTDFGVYRQDDVAKKKLGLKKKGGWCVDNGMIVWLERDSSGIITSTPVTKDWSDWIDYWSVDFNYGTRKEILGEWTGAYLFQNKWQSFRTKKDRSLKLESSPYHYESLGTYKVAIKVIDIFGNDTTKVITVKVG